MGRERERDGGEREMGSKGERDGEGERWGGRDDDVNYVNGPVNFTYTHRTHLV